VEGTSLYELWAPATSLQASNEPAAAPEDAAQGLKLVVEEGEQQGARIVMLRTKTDDDRSNCIAKLALLLEQAKDGRLRDVMILGFRSNTDLTLHWTPQTDANGFRFVGALQVLSNVLIARMKVNNSDG
jgi:hypothetical protein